MDNTVNEMNYIYKKIKDLFLQREATRLVNETELVTRCPFCGDSQKHKNHGHFYIGFKDTGVIVYYCHKCVARGTFTPDTLDRFGITDFEIREYISKKKKYVNNTNKFINTNYGNTIPNYIIPKQVIGKNKFKIDYFENRTGIRVTKEILDSYSLIFDLEDFLIQNHIPISSYSYENQYIIKELSENFLGFLSTNKSMISFRNVGKTKLSREKFNFVISDGYKKPFYYIPKSSIDLLTLNPKIILAEGPFDIICIKERFFPRDSTDTVFASVGGKAGYKKILKEIIGLTGFLNPEVLFFSDQDVDFETYTNNILGPLKNIIHGAVYYNTLSKDFGNINDDFKFEIYKF